jgi:hypothetical protein
MIEFIKKYRSQIVMLCLIVAGYLIRKFAPLSGAELELLDAIWVVLGFRAVFTPNFAQTKQGEP